MTTTKRINIYITIQNPTRTFLSPGIYRASTDKICAMAELIDHPAMGLLFKPWGIDTGRYLRPVDPLFWLNDEEVVIIEVDKVTFGKNCRKIQ